MVDYGRTDVETVTESVVPDSAPKSSAELKSQAVVKVKSDWWALRADLKPMSSYRQVHSDKG